MKLTADQARIRFVQDDLKNLEYTLERWEGREELGRLSEHHVVLRTRTGNLKLSDLFLKPATIEIDCYQDPTTTKLKKINGIIRKCSMRADEQQHYLYTFIVSPSLWRLSQCENTRIFQEKNSAQIIQQVIETYGYSCTMSLLTQPRTREFCVQYQESDLAFVSRLAEDDGFYFYFDQEQDQVIFLDASSQMPDSAPLTHYRWDPGQGLVRQLPETVTAFENDQQPRWRQVMVKDYNYKTPDSEMIEQWLSQDGEGSSYMYGVGFTKSGEGEAYAKLRLEEHRLAGDVLTLTSDIRSANAGVLFEFTDFPASVYNMKYQIIGIEHHYSSGAYYNTFQCLPLTTPFRPLRVTRRPVIPGLHIATVVGPDGPAAQGASAQDIYIDEMGRIKVLFNWDLDTSRAEASSCWARLISPYAGPGYGSFCIPRVGNEVLIAFLEGNPDRPIVVGSTQNGDNSPPLTLPGNKSRNTMKTPSGNEIRFEDKEGNEQVFINATKDQDSQVGNNETHTVANNRTKDIGVDETTTVGANRTESVGSNESITIGANQNLVIGGNRTKSVGADDTETIAANKTITVGASHTESVGSTMSITVGASLSESIGVNYSESVGVSMELTVGAIYAETVGASKTETVGGAKSVNVSGTLTENVGAACSRKIGGALSETVGATQAVSVGGAYKLNAQQVIIQGASQIKLTAGGSSITLKGSTIEIAASTIKLKGTTISLNGSSAVNIKAANVKSEASASNKVKGSMTNVEGSGVTTIKGSLVKIN